jgi:Domain of unknown function (DUF4440)
MKTMLSISLLVIVLGSAVVAQTKAKPSSDQARDVLLNLTDQITSAKSKKDVTQLERLLTDDFILTNPAGFVASRSEYLDGVKADTATYDSVTNHDQIVNVYDNAAVVTGSTIVKGRYAGNDIGGEFRFTNVFIKRQTGWQCAATQLTRVMQQ